MLDPISERRQYTRVPVHNRAMVCSLDCDGMPISPKSCTVADLSVGGAKISADASYHRGQVVALTWRAYSDAELHSAICLVAWAKYKEGEAGTYGLQFMQLSDRSSTVIGDEISHLLTSGVDAL